MGGSNRVGDGGSPQDVTWHDYAAVVRRFWWLLVLVVAVCALIAFVVSATQPKLYSATAQLRVVGPLTDSATFSFAINQANTDLRAREVITEVAKKFGGTLSAAQPYSVVASPESVSSGMTADPTSPTTLVAITATARDPEVAAALADAYARGFVFYRTSVARTKARESRDKLQAQMEELFPGWTPRQMPEPKDISGAKMAELIPLQQQYEGFAAAAKGSGGYVLFAEAVPPSSPSSPRPLRASVLGAAIGLLLSFFLVLVLRFFGAKIASGEEVSEILGTPILAQVVAPRSGEPDFDLVSLVDPVGAATDAYRRLRAGLPTLLARNDAKTVLFSEAEGRVDTSAVVANLAVSLARTGSRVVLLDANLRNPHVHRYFGLDDAQGLSTVLVDGADPDDVLRRVDVSIVETGAARQAGQGLPADLQVLPGGPAAASLPELLAGGRMSALLVKLAREADVVLLATSALLETADAVSLAGVVDGLVVVVDVQSVGRHVLDETRRVLDLLPCRIVGAVLATPSKSRLWSRRARSSASAPEKKPVQVMNVQQGESQ